MGGSVGGIGRNGEAENSWSEQGDKVRKMLESLLWFILLASVVFIWNNSAKEKGIWSIGSSGGFGLNQIYIRS